MPRLIKRTLSLLTAFLLLAGLLPQWVMPEVEARAAELTASNSSVLLMAAGEEHTVVLMENQSVLTFGRNQYGQLGDGTTFTRTMPVEVISPEMSMEMYGATITSIAAGANHSFAILADGRVLAWGRNNNGQLGDSTTANRSTPVLVTKDGKPFYIEPPDLGEEPKLSAGFCHTMAICKDDGYLYGWGLNSYGQLGTGNNSNKISPAIVNFYDFDDDPRGVLIDPLPADSVAAGYYHTLAYAGGVLYSFGCNTAGQLGTGDFVNRNKPTPVASGIASDIIRCGNSHSMALVGSSVYGWGSNAFGQISISINNPAIIEPMEMMDGVEDMQGGYYHTVMLKSDGTVYTQGYNSRGQLGNGVDELLAGSHTVQIEAPLDPDDFEIDTVPEAIFLEAQMVAAGYYFSAAIDTDGNLWLWGDNGYGQLGDATQIRRRLPNFLPPKVFYEDDVSTVNQVLLDADRLTVGIGTEYGATITSIIKPTNPLYDKIEWSVSNSDIVKVVKLPPDPDENSLNPTERVWVSGNKKAGTAVVTATAYNGKKATCFITVRPTAEIVNITNPPAKIIAVGSKIKLKTEVLPAATYNKDVVWSLVDDMDGTPDELTELEGEPGDLDYGIFSNDIGSIDQDGWFIAKSKGTAYVQAQSVMDPQVLAVVEIECGYMATSTSIYLDDYEAGPYPASPKSVTLYIDGRLKEDEGGATFYSRQLYAVNQPYGDGSDRSGQEFVWSCKPESVATIDEEGLLTPMKSGKATVYAKSTDKSGTYAKLEVVVVPIGEYIDITYPPTVKDEDDNLTATVNLGTKVNFKGKVGPSAASQKITWVIESSDPADTANSIVATIDEKTGAFTGRSVGSCVVLGYIDYVPEEDLDYPYPPPNRTEIRINVRVISPVSKMAIVPSSVIMTEGDDDVQLMPVFSPTKPTISEVDWSSSNMNAATVDEDGYVTAIAPGTAKIYAIAKDGTGKKAYSKITVMASPTGIELNWNEYTLSAGKSLTLRAKVMPYPGAYQDVKWILLNDGEHESTPGAATVGSNGVVKAFGTGTVYVVAVSAMDDTVVSEPCKITCVVPVKSFSVKPASIVLTKGGSREVAVNINPLNATDQVIKLFCDYGIIGEEDLEGNLIVENGMITLEATDEAPFGGPYTVTLMSGGKSAKIKVTVKAAPETASITSLSDGDMIWKGKTVAAKAVVEPATADQSVTWVSSNEEIARFDAKGNLKGVSSGEVDIYCITNTPGEDGEPVISETITLTCEVPVSSIKTSAKKTIELTLGGEDQAEVDVIVAPSNAYNSEGWEAAARRGEDIVELEQSTAGSILAIRPVAAGTDTINVSLGGKSTTIKVIVWDPPDSVVITTAPRASDSSLSSLIKGKTLQLKAKVYNSEGTTGTVKQTIFWESDDEGIAKVSKTGVVSVTGQGETFIRAYVLDADGNELYCDDDYYISTLLPITGLQIKPVSSPLTMYPGETLNMEDFTVNIKPIPEAYLGRTVKWKIKSSSSRVLDAEIDPDTGEFTIEALDVDKTTKCTVTVSVGDSTTGIKSAMINITVKPDPAAG